VDIPQTKKTYSLTFGTFLATVLQQDRKIAHTRDLKVKERYARACPKREKAKSPSTSPFAAPVVPESALARHSVR
jgi:hypothetical protein